MTQDISSLMDGELDPREADRIMRECYTSGEHKDTWNVYHAIGEAIRGQPVRCIERPTRVMEAISKEPTVIGGPRRNVLESMAGRIALAAAASVATIGVVSWIGTQGGAPGVSSSPIVAKSTPSRAIQPVEFTKAQPNVQDYLSAHRQIPSADSYRPVSNQQGAAAAR